MWNGQQSYIYLDEQGNPHPALAPPLMEKARVLVLRQFDIVTACLLVTLPALKRTLSFPTRQLPPTRYLNSFRRINVGGERSRRLDDTIPLTSTAVTMSPKGR